MKKYTQFMLLIGIFSCYNPLLTASNDNNGPYSPANIVPIVIKIAGAFLVDITSRACYDSILKYWDQKPMFPETDQIKIVTHAELAQNSYIPAMSKFLPTPVITSLQNNVDENQKHIHFDATTEHDATLLAQKIAFTTHSNYYKIERNQLAPQVDLAKLENTILKISQHAKNNKATVYIEFTKKELEATVHSSQMSSAHNLYKGTIAEALSELSKKYKIRFISNTPTEAATSKKPSTNSYYDPTKLLTDFKVINPPMTTDETSDFLVIKPKNLSQKEVPLYIAHTLKKYDTIAKNNQNQSYWFWNRPQLPCVDYKPIAQHHADNDFQDVMKNLTPEKINQASYQARITKLNNQEKAGILQQFCSLFLPRKTINIDQFDIFAEVYAAIPKYVYTFTQNSDMEDMSPKAPTSRVLTNEERAQNKMKGLRSLVNGNNAIISSSIKDMLPKAPTSRVLTNEERAEKGTPSDYTGQDRTQWLTPEYIASIKSSKNFNSQQPPLAIEGDQKTIREFALRKAADKKAHEDFLQRRQKIMEDMFPKHPTSIVLINEEQAQNQMKSKLKTK